MKGANILVVEDEKLLALSMKSFLEHYDYMIAGIVTEGKKAVEQAAILQPDLILMDIRLDGPMSGIEAAAKIRQFDDVPIIFTTAYISDELLDQAKAIEATGYMIKPLNFDELKANIDIALYNYNIEKELKKQQGFITAWFEATPDGAVIADIHGSVRNCNKSFSRFFRIDRKAIIGNNLVDYIKDIELTRYLPGFDNEPGQLKNHQYTIKWPDGEDIFLEINSEVVADADGKPLLCLFSFHDVTDARKAGEIIKQREQEFRLLVEKNPDIILRVDKNARIIYANPSVELYFGRTPDSLTNENMMVLSLSKRARVLWERLLAPAFSEGKEDEIYFNYNTNIGKRYLYSRILPESNAQGEIVSAIIISRDMTDFRMAEDGLLRLKIAFEQSIDGIGITDMRGNISFVNKAWAEMYNYHPDELKGQHLGIFFEPVYYENAVKPFIRQALDNGANEGEVDYRKKNGEIVTIWMTSTLIRDELGISVGYIIITRDISERKAAERRMAQINVELEKMVAERTAELSMYAKELEAFSYSVSHDLRAPLRGIEGFSNALLEDYSEKLGEEGTAYMKRISAGAKRMSQLIDDLLNLSVIARKDMAFEEVDMTEIAEKVADNLKVLDKERTVEVVIAKNLMASGDKRLLQIAFENLMGNAWKFTTSAKKPRIEVGKAVFNDHTCFFVSDNGVGFDMTYADKLFKPFQRLHSAIEFPGTGIGLAIVNRIISKHGGQIWADSRPGQGTTFYFKLK